MPHIGFHAFPKQFPEQFTPSNLLKYLQIAAQTGFNHAVSSALNTTTC